MATVRLETPDGEQLLAQLDPSTPLRIGRDPDNDLSVRDPRMSRHHARIVYERGFYVLYDLSSANGTFVAGKRVHVAPLVNGAILRMGNSNGRFEDAGDPPPAGTLVDQKLELPPTIPYGPADDDDPGSETNDFRNGLPPTLSDSGSNPLWSSDHYRLQLHGGREASTVETAGGVPLLWFHRPPRLIGWVASVVSAMILLTGIAAVAVLLLQERWLATLIALLVTGGALAVIPFLVPRNVIRFGRDAGLGEPAVILRQERRVPIPSSVYAALDPAGRPFARFRKNHLTNLGRRRWWIIDAEEKIVGWAEEDSLPRAVARKVTTASVPQFRSNYRFVYDGTFRGRIERREGANVLDLTPDLDRRFDRRIAVPLAALILAIEGR